MGTTLQVIASQGESAPTLTDRWSDWPLRGSEGGWLVLGRRTPLAIGQLEATAKAASMAGPAVFMYVESSDFAYAGVVTAGEVLGRAVLNRRWAEDLEDGVTALLDCRAFYGTDEWEPEAALALSGWCSQLGRSCDRERIEEVLAQELTDALEGIDSLLRALTVPSSSVLGSAVKFGEARNVTDWGGTTIRGLPLRFEEQRYVIGDGSGFLGVWDRESPEAPIARFPANNDGRMARDAFLITRCYPVQSPEFGAAWRVPIAGKFPLGPRGDHLTRLEDERFLLGWGVDFIGIWDRVHPQSPVARFPETEAGSLEAMQKWLRLRGTERP